MTIKRGDVYFCEKFYENSGSEMDLKKGRPCVVVSSDRFNEKSPTVIVAFCSHRYTTDNYINHVPLRSLKENGNKTTVCFGEQVMTVNKDRLFDYIGSVSEDDMYRVDEAISYCLYSKPNERYVYRFGKDDCVKDDVKVNVRIQEAYDKAKAECYCEIDKLNLEIANLAQQKILLEDKNKKLKAALDAVL